MCCVIFFMCKWILLAFFWLVNFYNTPFFISNSLFSCSLFFIYKATCYFQCCIAINFVVMCSLNLCYLCYKIITFKQNPEIRCEKCFCITNANNYLLKNKLTPFVFFTSPQELKITKRKSFEIQKCYLKL